MTERAMLERRVDRLEEALEAHDANNDFSLRWVDERRELLRELDEANAALTRVGGYREANSR